MSKKDSSPSTEPLVSVIIPAYNCQDYIRQCVRSVLKQTMGNFELICVDDGSTDSTWAILNRMATRDKRMRVIHQENKGEGAARNAGLDVAQGKYLLFVDADDFIDKTMLKKMTDSAAQGDCEIVICGVESYNTQSGATGVLSWGCGWRAYPYGMFSAKDNPIDIFRCFQNWTWNKLFLAEFIHRYDLRFDEVQRCADLFFVDCALSAATRIRCVPQPLYHYRTNNPSSNIATCDRAPLDFYESFIRTQKWMIDHGTYDLVEQAFRNWVIGSIFSNFQQLHSWSAFCELFDYLRADECAKLRELDLLDMPISDYLDQNDIQKMEALTKAADATEFLFALYRSASACIELMVEQSASQQKTRESVHRSALQFGRAIGQEVRGVYYQMKK